MVRKVYKGRKVYNNMKKTTIKLKPETRDKLMTIKYSKSHKSMNDVIESLISESNLKKEEKGKSLKIS